ncbi:peptide transporter ptr2 [Aspergillus melleus]|uniref:peptide transporter ptr2 n=1 Tax=Aspergillus melleus TaxID=138277 RepID=UPI001E8D155D|nr:peptide transporter ptr2 [Aspergillus melleus]KAH8427249.1 peptide transporter ptr2 [Aspergillus melleus]
MALAALTTGDKAPIDSTITSTEAVESATRAPATADPEKNAYEITASSSAESDEYPTPTEEEEKVLRKVAGNLPLVSFSLCLVEFAERASYYGAKTVFSNFIQFPLPEGMLFFPAFNIGSSADKRT